MSMPEWVKKAIFYQIFPDRYYNGDPTNDPENVQPWGSTPTLWNFQGGDLEGITQKLDYLLDLGINAIYLNPIFRASSSHRYNTSDYYEIDPKLGDLNNFHRLIDTAHMKGIKIILDGVFNHTGRGFFAFNDILENGAYSPYKNWYHIHKIPVDAYGKGDAVDYYGWWNYKSLPKLNTNHPPVRKYLFGIAEHWIKLGADGWRLDVPNEIDDDSFWEEICYRVRKINPEAYLLGEIWDINARWVDKSRFDGLMNYPLKREIVSFLTQARSSDDLAVTITSIHAAYPERNLPYMYNLLGSHDTKRIFSVLNEDEALVKLAFLLIFTLPGAPAIYYGDEIGITGGKDPLSRKAFPWDKNDWRAGLRSWIQKLIFLRKEFSVLRSGEVKLIQTGHQNAFCFARKMDQEVFIVLINLMDNVIELELPLDGFGLMHETTFQNLLGGDRFIFQHNSCKLPVKIKSKSGMLLKAA